MRRSFLFLMTRILNNKHCITLLTRNLMFANIRNLFSTQRFSWSKSFDSCIMNESFRSFDSLVICLSVFENDMTALFDNFLIFLKNIDCYLSLWLVSTYFFLAFELLSKIPKIIFIFRQRTTICSKYYCHKIIIVNSLLNLFGNIIGVRNFAKPNFLLFLNVKKNVFFPINLELLKYLIDNMDLSSFFFVLL